MLYTNNNTTSTSSSSSLLNNQQSLAGLGIDCYEDEPPLLEELGIRFDHIWSKTLAVLFPNKIKSLTVNLLEDADLAGPMMYCLLLGACLLLSGKVHFGYIYGFSLFGCFGMYLVINLLTPNGLDLSRTCSVLGYCLLPVSE